MWLIGTVKWISFNCIELSPGHFKICGLRFKNSFQINELSRIVLPELHLVCAGSVPQGPNLGVYN